jgi:transcriptional regulator GlxA family with amidase domain
MKLRLKHARWMLRSCKSLAVVAVETGFANGSRLSAALKRTYDNSPSAEQAGVTSPPGSADLDHRRHWE